MDYIKLGDVIASMIHVSERKLTLRTRDLLIQGAPLGAATTLSATFIR
ncbi:hypothetical protein ACQR1I_31640 [Bradyrhizobium sp. HKCCYLS2038]